MASQPRAGLGVIAAAGLCTFLALAGGCSPGRPAAAPAAAVPPGELNQLFNGSFEEWEGGMPKAWGLAQGAGLQWLRLEGQPVRGALAGSKGIEVPAPPAGQLAILAQNVPSKELRPGRTLYFAAGVYADAPGAAAIVLTWGGEDGQQKVRADHPGGGQWQRLEGSAAIPRSANLGSFRLELFRMPAEGRVLFDEAGVSLRDPDRTP